MQPDHTPIARFSHGRLLCWDRAMDRTVEVAPMHRFRPGYTILFVALTIASIGRTTTEADVASPRRADGTLLHDGGVASLEKARAHEVEGPASIEVVLAASHTTVSWDARLDDPQRFELPLVYLHRERSPAAERERTLHVGISGPVGGAEVEIELLSWHVNVATSDRHHETVRVRLPDSSCTTGEPCRVKWTLDAERMLSDLYSLYVRTETGTLLWQNTDQDRPDLAVLDTWDVPADEYTVRVTYATLFSFDRGPDDPIYRLRPDAVTDFVERRFVPIILETWHTQFHTWGFGPIHPDWDRDNVVEIYVTAPPFALFDGTGTYTVYAYEADTPHPERRLWWYASNSAFRAYDSLEDGYKATFAHEFFHLVQWNVLLSSECSTQGWMNTFIEAQGKFAPSVQYPEIEILGEYPGGLLSRYGAAARHFLKDRLNTSYRALEADAVERYDLALYWRFLYEQFGDMGIIRAALEEMACQYDPDIVSAMGSVMDAALARSDGPFWTFEESLVAFAQANYALRLAGGRCEMADLDQCEGRYYDPNGTYPSPPVEAALEYSGARLTYDGSVPASFGMDFVEVRLYRRSPDQPLHVAVQSDGAELNIEVWQLDRGMWDRPRALTPQPARLAKVNGDLYALSLPRLDPQCERLAVIVTRLDADEGTGPTGNYTITLDSTPVPGKS